MVLSAMMAAGKKDTENRFSGVLMGDIAKAGDKDVEMTGIVGYKEGLQSFALKNDGTAFLGLSGGGRIYIDGDKGHITSSNFSDTGGEKGMDIDLKEGEIITPYFRLGPSINKIAGWTIGENTLYAEGKEGGSITINSDGSISGNSK